LGESFDLQFDDLYGNEADYYYTIEQYNYDWTPTQLLKNEYLNGLDNQRIQNYQNSLNCLQIYSHYTLSFPNKFNQIIKSGNYIVKIFDEDQEIVFLESSLYTKTPLPLELQSDVLVIWKRFTKTKYRVFYRL